MQFLVTEFLFEERHFLVCRELILHRLVHFLPDFCPYNFAYIQRFKGREKLFQWQIPSTITRPSIIVSDHCLGVKASSASLDCHFKPKLLTLGSVHYFYIHSILLANIGDQMRQTIPILGDCFAFLLDLFFDILKLIAALLGFIFLLLTAAAEQIPRLFLPLIRLLLFQDVNILLMRVRSGCHRNRFGMNLPPVVAGLVHTNKLGRYWVRWQIQCTWFGGVIRDDFECEGRRDER
mmetsp:Transcript_1922/g.3211  ORF Transcript_1922/g.3211 Transcript_1922/m.3211 type:complete len:235 (-) Transcript_1922:158-862(-)